MDAAVECFQGCGIFVPGVRLRGKQCESGGQGGCCADSGDDFSVAGSLRCCRRDFPPGVVAEEQHVKSVDATPGGQDAAEGRVEGGDHGPDQQKIYDPAEDQKIAGPDAAVQNFYGGDEFPDGQSENQYGACEQKRKFFAVKFACCIIPLIAQVELDCTEGCGDSGEHHDFHNAVDAAEGGNEFQRQIGQRNAFTHFRQDMTAGEQRFRVKLLMGHVATGLLLENYPGADAYMKLADDGRHELDVPVCSFSGVGRFVLGIFSDIEVLGSPEFIEWLRARVAQMSEKMDSLPVKRKK